MEQFLAGMGFPDAENRHAVRSSGTLTQGDYERQRCVLLSTVSLSTVSLGESRLLR